MSDAAKEVSCYELRDIGRALSRGRVSGPVEEVSCCALRDAAE